MGQAERRVLLPHPQDAEGLREARASSPGVLRQTVVSPRPCDTPSSPFPVPISSLVPDSSESSVPTSAAGRSCALTASSRAGLPTPRAHGMPPEHHHEILFLKKLTQEFAGELPTKASRPPSCLPAFSRCRGSVHPALFTPTTSSPGVKLGFPRKRWFRCSKNRNIV